MKALKISTALSLMIIAGTASQALAVGDPNTDTGIGSKASRGIFAYSNNNGMAFQSDSDGTPTNGPITTQESTFGSASNSRGQILNGSAGALSANGQSANGLGTTFAGRIAAVRRLAPKIYSSFSSGDALQSNKDIEMENKLKAMNLPAESMIGTITGSMLYGNGDMITFGTRGRMRVAPDNSGTITLNSGEVMSVSRITPRMRQIALRSLLLF